MYICRLNITLGYSSNWSGPHRVLGGLISWKCLGVHGCRKSTSTALGHSQPQVTHRSYSKGHAQLVSQHHPRQKWRPEAEPPPLQVPVPGLGLALCTDSTARTVSLLWEACIDTRENWKHTQCWLGTGSSKPHSAVSPVAVTSDRGSQSCWGQGCNTPKHGACPVLPDAAALRKTVLWIKWCCWFIPFPLAHVSHLSTLDCSLMKSLFLTSTS